MLICFKYGFFDIGFVIFILFIDGFWKINDLKLENLVCNMNLIYIWYYIWMLEWID